MITVNKKINPNESAATPAPLTLSFLSTTKGFPIDGSGIVVSF